MKLIFNIAWTHVSSRVRQTLVGMAGVSMGVGFTIMMAGLMQGSQIDFLRQLVDTMPHITMEDERRSVPTQPAEQEYGAVQMSDIAKGTTVLSPARRDLADGTRIRIDNSLTRAVESTTASEPADQPIAAPEPTVVTAVTEVTAATPTDPDDAVISAAISAHIDSVVSDARRNIINR